MQESDKSFGEVFGLAVRTRREQLGLSQESLAFRAGLHRNYISDIELGLKSPTLRVIVRLAEALGVTVSTLIRVAETMEQRRTNDLP